MHSLIPAALEAPYLQGLNAPQREAVMSLDGPVLVLAGAGTGKTRVLTTRLAHLLQTNRAWPSQILSVTFTNKAAQEMKHRVSKILGDAPVEGWWLGTFHALAARMLRKHAEIVGLTSNFTIIDTDDQERLLKQLMVAENIDVKKWTPRAMMAVIGRWKDKALRPQDIASGDAGDYADGKLLGLYMQYQQRLKTINACDFGDLLLHMITIFRDPANHDLLREYHNRFKYIMVDEYQDTNVAQYMWLRLLAQGSGNICCVGDDDQSIYGWRGAEVGNILRFEHDFPGAKIIRLEQNYRSTGHILAAASGIIAKNESRLGKTLWSDSEQGDKVIVRGLWDGSNEAQWIGEEIESLQRKGGKLNNMAVLVRAGSQMLAFEKCFGQMGIPHRIIGGTRFYEREEIRDALAYLRVIAQRNDDLALGRILNKPKRGLGDATEQLLASYARARGITLYESILQLCETDELKPKVRDTLRQLTNDFERWNNNISTMNHVDLVKSMLDESGYMAMWMSDKSIEAPGKIDNLKALVSDMAEFESLAEFLEHVSLVMEAQQAGATEDAVTLMTLHGAKGLEFDAIFLPGWEEGLFPSQRSMDENGVKGLEEERRLAYVGITRARKRAHISYVANRFIYGKSMSAIPSRFVDELPEDNIESEADTGLYNAGHSKQWDNSGFAATRVMSTPVRRTPLPESSQFDKGVGGAFGFSRGDKVLHDSFGPGTITHVDGHKLDIAFNKGGQKRVMDSFVQKDE